MDITEPVTMLTDYALGGVNLFFCISVFSNITSRNKVTGLLLGLGFLAGAIAAVAGGTYHGFALHFEQNQLRRMWNLVMCISQVITHKRPEHIYVAMGKVDQAQNAIHHRVSQRDERISTTLRDTVDELL